MKNGSPIDAPDFDHFIKAQDGAYARVLAELRAGRKTSHWMWFVFPQLSGLGKSAMSELYALHSIDEAQDYLENPVLAERLKECTAEVLRHQGATAHQIFGSPDDLKFHASMTLFHRAAPGAPLFKEALDAFFSGREHEGTQALLAGEGGSA